MSGLKQKNKEILEEVYQSFGIFSASYKVDLVRFYKELCFIETNFKERGKLLDIGCGPGILSSVLSCLGFEVTGVDKYIFPQNKNDYFNVRDFGSLQQLWHKYNVNILPYDYRELTTYFQPATFDVIICDAFIEHLKESPRRLLETARALLRDGGYLIISTPNLATALKRFRFLCGRSCLWDIEDYYRADLFLGHIREFTAEEIGKMCKWAGFEIVKLHTQQVFSVGSARKIGLLRKIIRIITVFLGFFIPNSKDMIYCVAQKINQKNVKI